LYDAEGIAEHSSGDPTLGQPTGPIGANLALHCWQCCGKKTVLI